MDRTREDRIYELQQALTVMPSDAWREYLAAQCPNDVGLQNELLQRQHQLQSDIVRPSPIGFDFSEASLAPLPYSSIEQASSWLDPLGYDVIAELGRGGMVAVILGDLRPLPLKVRAASKCSACLDDYP